MITFVENHHSSDWLFKLSHQIVTVHSEFAEIQIIYANF